MEPVVVVVLVVAAGVLALLFGADSRPGPEVPPQRWITTRHDGS